MENVERLRAGLPEAAKDIKLNLQTVLQGASALSTEQRWGVAVASAIAARQPQLLRAVLADARAAVGEAVIEDAKAATVLMGMNNVYYRFRHLVGKESYTSKPARLRMNRLGQAATTRGELELFSLAVSAINGCEMCVRAHEKVVVDGGLSEEHVHDAVRLAATILATAVALDLAAIDATAPAAALQA
jgi:alkyl hydroperoxide reductase subunit D